MLLRVLFALFVGLVVPATASADLRSPVLGESAFLSSLTPATSTGPPAIGTDGNTTFAAYSEERYGVVIQQITATGTEIGAAQELQGPGTVSLGSPKLVVDGQHVYVAWVQESGGDPYVVVAASHDGGSTFGPPVRAGKNGAYDVTLAADGATVFVAFLDEHGRLWTAGSRDGGRTFPCVAIVTPAGDESRNGGAFSMAVGGTHVYWTWLSDDFDIWVRRSTDAGRTLEPAERLLDNPEWKYPGLPGVRAVGTLAVIAFSEEYRTRNEQQSRTDFGAEPEVFVTANGGASWARKDIGGEESRCVGNACSAPYSLLFTGDDVYLGWHAAGSMWVAASHDGGDAWTGPTVIGPYTHAYRASHAPALSARGDTVVASWYTAPAADSTDLDVLGAFSSDRGRTFALTTVAGGPKSDLHPSVAAWGPEPEGAGFAWWALEGPSAYSGDTNVKFAPMSAAAPDVEVLDVRPFQVALDAARLAAGRPTTVRAMLRSKAPQRVTVKLKVEAGGRTVEEDVVLRPGLNPVQLLAADPLIATPGTLRAKVTVDPSTPDSDPANNVGEGVRAVVQPRPLKLLFVPVAAEGELRPACQDVRAVADGADEYLRAAWPIDPAQLEVVADCSTTLFHTAGLTETGLMGLGGLLPRVDRLKWESGATKVIGVVPQGWFSRQRIDGFAEAIGVAPLGGGLDAALVERQNVGGWVVAHELAHNFGSEHRNDEPAPGYWVTERRDIPATTRDFLHFSTTGADVQLPTARWTSKATWDALTTELATGATTVGPALALTGSVKDGVVTTEPAFEVDGPVQDTTGPYSVEQVGANGAVLDTRSFAASNELEGLGGHAVTEAAAFSVRVPAKAAAQALRIRRGGETLVERVRSAAAPVVHVDTPARVPLGDDLKVTWTASDADGDALTSVVSLSLDGGATWRPFGEATTARSLSLKTIVALAGTDVRVRVMVSDGWNTTTSESGTFTIGGTLTDGKIVAENAYTSELFEGTLDGAPPKKLADGLRGRYSPDGTELGYLDNQDPHVARADGTGVRRVKDEADTLFYGLDWLPDGSGFLIAKSNHSGQTLGNVVMDAWTGAETPYAKPYGEICGFSRDGSRIAFQGGLIGGGFSIFRADGSLLEALPGPISGYNCMRLSPDNRYGVTTRGEGPFGQTRDVVVWDLKTGERRNVTDGGFGGENDDPTWSPTGEWIVCEARAGELSSIWKIRPDGTDAQEVMRGFYGRPDVQPLRGLTADPEPTLQERKPVAAVAEREGVEGTPITLDASGSKPGEDGAAIASYGWDLDGDGTFDDAAGVAPRTTFPDEGEYPVRVLVTDGQGRSATAEATVTVTNAAPVLTEVQVTDEGAFSARFTDADTPSATVDGKPVPVIAGSGGSYSVLTRGGHRIVVDDGDGGTVVGEAARVLAPAPVVERAEDAGATVVAGASIDLDLPAEGGEVVLVDPPAHGTIVLRAASPEKGAPDVTYTADEVVGGVSFTYRVGESRVATVKVDVTSRPGAPIVLPEPGPVTGDGGPLAVRPSVQGSKPVDVGRVESVTAAVEAAATFTLPSSKACVSRRKFSIRVKRGDYREVLVWVNGKRVKTLRGKRITAGVDLRGLPKGRFTVKIAATLSTGKVIKSSRAYRTCTSKKGGRS